MGFFPCRLDCAYSDLALCFCIVIVSVCCVIHSVAVKANACPKAVWCVAFIFTVLAMFHQFVLRQLKTGLVNRMHT